MTNSELLKAAREILHHHVEAHSYAYRRAFELALQGDQIGAEAWMQIAIAANELLRQKRRADERLN